MAGTASPPQSSPPVRSDRIAKAAGLSAVATATSRVLGLVREQVLAALFGATDQMDAFLVAVRIPNLLRDLFAEGAMSAAFVPTFTRELELGGKEKAWRLGNNVLTALVLITGAFVLVGLIFARPLVATYASSFADVPGKIELSTGLARVMMPFLALAAVAAAVMGMLNSLRHYFLPALAPATFNVVAIVFAVALTPVMTGFGLPPITSIALAVTVGGITQVALQWPVLHREGFRLAPTLDLRDPALRRVLVMMGPGTIGLAATQMNLFVSTWLASGQGTGAVSWLQYAFRIMYLPLGLFGVSIATAVLPAASRQAALRDHAGIRDTVRHGLTLMVIVVLPATCGLVLLSPEIVRLLFQHGRFTSADTAATAAALRFYAVGLIGYATTRIASPVFYALGRNRVPVVLSAGSVLINLALSLVLVRLLGFSGLALATSMAALANAALCVWIMRGELGGLGGRALAAVVLKLAVASAVMVAAIEVVRPLLPSGTVDDGILMQTVALLGAIGIGLLALLATAYTLRVDEVMRLLKQLRGRRLSRDSRGRAEPA